VARGTALLPAYHALLRDWRFLTAAVVAGLATTIPYAYLTAAPFVYAGIFKLTGGTYSLMLALNAVCSIGTTQLSPLLMRRWGPRPLLLRISSVGVLLTATAAAAFALAGDHLIAFQIFSMLLFGLAGLLLTPAAVTALDAGGAGAGAAAGMLGALQLTVTAAASGIISLFPAFSLTPLLWVLGGSLALAAVLSWPTAPLATGPAGPPKPRRREPAVEA
jgi:DHA1 family bicyclomycin/chloramphenicol resistance-like MFS transporter